MDERTLIEQAGRGDAEAFEQLVVSHQRIIYNLALRMTGNREDAADLTQETFIKAWHAISLFQFDSKFTTWLCRIASNACIDFLRKQKKRRSVSLTAIDDFDESYEMAVTDSNLNPAELLDAAADREMVYAALRQLPTEYRIVLSLRAIEDMSYQEIGEALDLNPGTVKSRISRARQRLRKMILGNISAGSASDTMKGGTR